MRYNRYARPLQRYRLKVSSIEIRHLIAAISFCLLVAAPAFGQESFSAVYSDTWTDGAENIDYDEEQPSNEPVAIGCGVGEIDPDASEQYISAQTT